MVDPVSSGRNNPITGQQPISDAERPRAASLKDVRIPRAVTLSALVQLTRAVADAGPPLDYAKIAALREAIASGTYKVDPQAIAQAITAFHRKGAA